MGSNIMAERQRILVFQQNRSGESKISGIRRFGGERLVIATHDIDDPLPGLIDDTSGYLPETMDADLVLDYLRHPDLSLDLWRLCERMGIPVVASGRKETGGWALTPRICCALPWNGKMGNYGRLFGAPEFEVTVNNGIVAGITVLRGAPCGATWEAAEQTIGVPVEEAAVHIGLRTQYHCTADPAGWDVMYGKSPVHYSAKLHMYALMKALNRLI